MGPQDVLKAILATDTVSSTAAAVQAANPQIWASPAYVPDFAFKSLGEIWMGIPAATTVGTRINTQLGAGSSYPDGNIYIVNMQQMSPSFVPGVQIDQDSPGTEVSTIDFIFKNPQIK